MDQPTLVSTDDQGILTLTLNRPEVRNALDEALIGALHAACDAAAAREDVRAIVLRGSGPAFCSGADLAWMERTARLDAEANRADAHRFARMLSALWDLPQPLIGAVHGPAIGGAVGLVAACDLVIAAPGAYFQFREARVGLVPATIGPLVMAKLHPGAATPMFLTARRVGARRAREMGLVHEVVDDEDGLEAALEAALADIRAGGPQALREAKRMTRELSGLGAEAMRKRLLAMADRLAAVRSSGEAKEGFRAFLEKRPPHWAKEEQ